jgi:catechol 2,3-dioxygenase-like lactoylglutathione lyase family enzyme
LAEHGRKHLLFSFHSIPKRYLLAGDPYHCFCLGTAREVAARLGLGDDDWSVGFQSRFGREEWLKPYVDVTLQEYARTGPKRVTVVCPGFATDCLETLEEISMQNRELFLQSRWRGVRLRALPQFDARARGRDGRRGDAAHRGMARDGCKPPGRYGARGDARACTGPRRAALTARSARPDMPLGRFLEVSVAAADVAESLAFYEALGFVQAAVGEAWRHPYAVVTDGRLSIGLHGAPFEASPLLTWVAPDLRNRMAELTRLGLVIEEARLDDSGLHEVFLRSPSGQPLRLLEARTFSPPSLAPGHVTQLGYFEEVALSTSTGDPDEAHTFWEKLGFVAFEPAVEPFTRIVASSRDLNVALYDLALSTPALVFSAASMADRIEELRDRGFRFARRLPRELTAVGAAMLEAPEGTCLLLVEETFTAP